MHLFGILRFFLCNAKREKYFWSFLRFCKCFWVFERKEENIYKENIYKNMQNIYKNMQTGTPPQALEISIVLDAWREGPRISGHFREEEEDAGNRVG